MEPTFTQSILDRTHAYIAGSMSPDDFKDWLIGATWNVEREHPDAAGVTYDIKLLLAEHSNGDLSDSELRTQLHALTAVHYVSAAR